MRSQDPQVAQHPLNWPAEVMTATEVAATARVHPKTVRADIRAGRLAASDIGNGIRPTYRISAGAAQQWWQERLVTPTGGIEQMVSSGRAALVRRGRIPVSDPGLIT